MNALPAVRPTHRGAPRTPAPQTPRRRRARRMRAAGTVLLVAGALLLVDAALTLTWREPITSLLASRAQAGLRGDLRRLDLRFPNLSAGVASLAPVRDEAARVALLAAQLHRVAHDGDAIGRITIPKLGASFVMVYGTTAADLRTGPGLYPGQPLPGQGGTAAIAGHRTTYLAPFRHIDRLRPGDRIAVDMPYATIVYAVTRTRIVAANDVSVLRADKRPHLVLTACHPLFSASHRIAVFARQVSVRPSAALRRVERAVGRTANLSSAPSSAPGDPSMQRTHPTSHTP